MKFLNNKGISSSQLHKRNDLHPFLKSKKEVPLTGLDKYLSRMLHIPCGWWLNDNDLDYIVESIKKFKS